MTTQNALNTQLVLPAGSTAINSLLYTSAANVVAGLATVNSAALVTSSTGVPTWLGSLTNGQIIIGSTGAIPVASTLSAGTNVTITNAAGSITINANGGTVNSGSINQLAYYAAAGTAVSGLATANNGILITSGSGVPSIATTFGSGLSVTGSQLIVGLGSNIPFSQGFGIQDSAGLKELVFNVAVSAVNYFTMGNAATGANPSLLATGTDSNIGISLLSKGTSGIVMTGVSDASSVAAGFVGEIVSSVILFGSPVSFTTAVSKNLTSISLTAGDWDVWGNVWGTGATYIQINQSGISTTTNTLPDNSLTCYIIAPASTSGQLATPVPQIRVSISSTTTYYLVVNLTGVGAMSGSGGIYARRRR